MAKEKHAANDTEKGFGTGLRAQLERRRAALLEAQAESGADEAQAAAEIATEQNGSATTDIEAVREELAASLAREESLRAALSEGIVASERGLELDEQLAARAADLDGREAGLADLRDRLEADRAELERTQAALAKAQAQLGDVFVGCIELLLHQSRALLLGDQPLP